MNWKRYQNELMVGIAFLLMFSAYFYKHKQMTAQASYASTVKHSVGELKEIIALKKVWADTRTGKKVEQVGTLIPASKVKWSQKSKKVSATYEGLTSNELNSLITKILNLPVVIQQLDIQKTDLFYHVEFKCEW